ncbi:MAG: hypothetical protein ABIJ09_16400 [Pseudomonadota bacterium]
MVLSSTLLLALVVSTAPPVPVPVLTIGQPTPLARRPVTLPALSAEFSFRYGLVGNGPTRFVNDIRFAPLDWLELRTSLGPIPESLMVRVALGDLDRLGVFSVDGGLYKLDLGFRLDPTEAESVRGVVALNLETGIAYDHAVTSRGRVHVSGRAQQRWSNIDGWDQTTVMGALWGDVDLTHYLGLSVGAGYGQVVAGQTRDFTINFSELGRSGFSTLLDHDNDRAACTSVGMTYARTESFDVDLFATLRVWPEVGTLFGAGLRWRI